MGKRGPKKGHGGRPRKPIGAGKPRADGYRRTSVGKPSKGTQVYEHRAVAFGGKPPKSSKSATHGIVDHKDSNKSNNSKKNLRIVSKSENNRKKKR